MMYVSTIKKVKHSYLFSADRFNLHPCATYIYIHTLHLQYKLYKLVYSYILFIVYFYTLHIFYSFTFSVVTTLNIILFYYKSTSCSSFSNAYFLNLYESNIAFLPVKPSYDFKTLLVKIY
jgi:hypothetical protein